MLGGAVSCINVLVGGTASTGAGAPTTGGTACQPRVDVFAFKTVAASAPNTMGGLPRVVALSNIPGSIEIIVTEAGISRSIPCTSSTSTSCEATTPASTGGITYEQAISSRVISYQAILRPASGGPEVRSQTREFQIARQDQLYKRFCVDETHVSDDGLPSSAGVSCSPPTPVCTRPGKQRISNAICVNTGCEGIEINCATCTGAGTGTLCYTGLLPSPPASEGGGGQLRLSIPLCPGVTGTGAPPSGAAPPIAGTPPVTVSPTDQCPPPAGVSGEITSIPPLTTTQSPSLKLEINGKPSATDSQGSTMANKIPITRGGSFTFTVTVVSGNSFAGSVLAGLPIRYYITQFNGATWSQAQGQYGVGFGFSKPVGQSCEKTIIQTSQLPAGVYAVHVVAGASAVPSASSNLVYFEISGAGGPSGGAFDLCTTLTGGVPSTIVAALNPPAIPGSNVNFLPFRPDLRINGQPNPADVNNENSPIPVVKGEQVTVTVASQNQNLEAGLPIRIYIDEKSSDGSWAVLSGVSGVGLGYTQSGCWYTNTIPGSVTSGWRVGLYRAYVVIGEDVNRRSSSPHVYFRVNPPGGGIPGAPPAPSTCPSGASISAELTDIGPQPRMRIRWTSVPDSTYNVRVADLTNDAYNTELTRHYDDTNFNNCPQHYVCEDNVNTLSLANIPVFPGHTYAFWRDTNPAIPGCTRTGTINVPPSSASGAPGQAPVTGPSATCERTTLGSITFGGLEFIRPTPQSSAVTLSWNRIPTAQLYNVRLDDGSTQRDTTDVRFTNCNQDPTQNPHYYCKNNIPNPGTSSGGVIMENNKVKIQNVPVTPGRMYNFWVDPVGVPGCTPDSLGVGMLSDGIPIPQECRITPPYTNTDEQNQQVVRCAYKLVLSRGADEGTPQSGLEIWTDQLRGGMSRRNLLVNFFNSEPEGRNKYSSTSMDNAQFVDALYANLLRRLPDVNGKNAWLGTLTGTNPWARQRVFEGFIDSDEFKDRLFPFFFPPPTGGAGPAPAPGQAPPAPVVPPGAPACPTSGGQCPPPMLVDQHANQNGVSGIVRMFPGLIGSYAGFPPDTTPIRDGTALIREGTTVTLEWPDSGCGATYKVSLDEYVPGSDRLTGGSATQSQCDNEPHYYCRTGIRTTRLTDIPVRGPYNNYKVDITATVPGCSTPSIRSTQFHVITGGTQSAVNTGPGGEGSTLGREGERNAPTSSQDFGAREDTDQVAPGTGYGRGVDNPTQGIYGGDPDPGAEPDTGGIPGEAQGHGLD